MKTTLPDLESDEDITEVFPKNPFFREFQDSPTKDTSKDTESVGGIDLGTRRAKSNTGGANLKPKTQKKG